MKITQNLHQFINVNALIAVTGTMTAKLYLVKDGQIQQVDSIKLAKPNYSDKEEFFARKTATENISGSVYESPREYLRSQFLHDFQNEIKDIYAEHGFDTIFLIAPRYVLRDVENRMPKKCREMIKLRIAGNVIGKHPNKLLEIIKNKLNEMIEEQKIIQLDEVKRLM